MIDGAGSLMYDVQPEKVGLKVRDEVIVRRSTNRSGPQTSEVRVGQILALGETTAKVSMKKAGGFSETKEVALNQLSPVTLAFKRSSVQFQPAFRGMV